MSWGEGEHHTLVGFLGMQAYKKGVDGVGWVGGCEVQE